VTLRVEDAGLVFADEFEGRGEQLRGQPGAACVCGRAYPSNPRGDWVLILENAQVSQRIVGLTGGRQPEMASAGFQVSAVEFRVWALLLDDENVGAQPQEGVEGGGVELLERRDSQDHPPMVPSLSITS
jgi:hypothetical protein